MFTDKKNKHNNKYGYQVDITKPKYRELYERYKKYKNIPGVRVTGIFDDLTEKSVLSLQKRYQLLHYFNYLINQL